MQTVIITGGTGMIGTALGQSLLLKGYRVIILSRNTKKTRVGAGLSYATWDVERQTIDEAAIGKADYIIHLAGAGVADKRWSENRKKEIVDSRVQSCQLIVKSLQTIPNNVKALVSASAIGWYGPDEETGKNRRANLFSKPFTEDDPPATDFLGKTCMRWEESIQPVAAMGKRLVILRTGIVLSREGGALEEFLKPLKFGVAAILGNGRQVISWIHIDDLVNMYIAALENTQLHGVYNAVASNPVSNKELTLALAWAKRNYFLPVHIPSFQLKIVLGEMSIEVLKSATVSNEKIRNTGFDFLFDTIPVAIKDLVSS